MSFSFGASPAFGAASSSSATSMTGLVGPGASSLQTPKAAAAAAAKEDAAKSNLVGIFSGDWATDDKVALLAESYTVFNSLQKIAAEARSTLTGAGPSSSAALTAGIPSPQTLQYFHRISGLYRDALRRYLLNLEASDEALEADVEQAQLLHTILHLTETLYLPADGRGAGVVGEEVLHWLNTFDFAPRTEEGQEIAQSAVPYQHPAYWDYILRCVLRGFHNAAASVLQSLAQHPSKSIQGIVTRTAKLLSTLPRSTAFRLETDFVSAHRRWLTQVRSTLSGLEADLDEMEAEMARLGTDAEDVEDERLEFEAQFRCLLELMAGVKDRVFEACEDWREALGAWGTLVQPAMKRDDLPEIMNVVLKHFPIDASPQAEAVQVALVKGEVAEACELSGKVDPWLAVHLTDLLDKVGVLEDDESEGKGQSAMDLRDGFVGTYAETLLDDQGLWRLSLDYLAACEGGISQSRRRMREILLDVPLLGEEAERGARGLKTSLEDMEREAQEDEMDEDELDPARAKEERERRKEEQRQKEKVSDEFSRVEEVLGACVDHGMELEARAICKHLATQMATERRYGVAVSYAVRAGDGRQVKRIADQLLDEYIERGSEVFCHLVDSMPASLLEEAASVSAMMDLRGREKEEEGEGGKEEDERMSILGAAAAAGDAPRGLDAQQAYGFGRKLFSSRLTFLARYRDFHLLYAQGLLAHAASLLVQLLESNVAPERFWAILLVDAIPLLEGGGSGGGGKEANDGSAGDSQDLFDMHQTFEMLRILEQITGAMQSGLPDEANHYLEPLERLLQGGATATGTKGKLDLKAASKRLDVVRFGLARQLARCSVHALAPL